MAKKTVAPPTQTVETPAPAPAKARPAVATQPPPAVPTPAPIWAKAPAQAGGDQSVPQSQSPVELRFVEGSTYWSMPREEQERLLGYYTVYRKELARLLDEGEAGRFAVIKGDLVAHVWDTVADAMQAGTLFIGPQQFAVYQIKPQDMGRLALGEEATRSPCPQ